MFKQRDLSNLWWKKAYIFVFLLGIFSLRNTEAIGWQANDTLFTDALVSAVPSAQIEREMQDPTIRRSRHVHGNFNLLKDSKTSLSTQPLPDMSPPGLPQSTPVQKRSITLNLFNDVSFTAVEDRMEERSANRYTWYGHIEGIDQSQVILVNEDGDMAGAIFVGPNEQYQIRPVGGGVHAVYDVDTSAFLPEAEPIAVYTQDTSALSPPTAGCCDNGSTIDVMVVYTSAAAAASGNIVSEIQLAIDQTNTAYANSLISQRLRLVHTAQVAYTEIGNSGTDLNRLQNPSDGYLDEVQTLRNTYHADIVSLYVESLTDACGMGYVMTDVSFTFESKAFNVVRRSCATSTMIFAHELGHNMGARHDRANAGTAGAYSYSYGYIEPGRQWRTIMAYPGPCSGCPIIPNFSNPLVTHNSVPTGILEGQSNSADNAKTLNNTAYTVSNFRQSDGSITPDTFSATGSMTIGRMNHTATLLPDGRVLVTGGRSGSSYYSTAELYDPVSETFTKTASMSVARADHTATLLPNGLVLITGGFSGSSYLSSAELYDPASGMFTATGSMSFTRARHTATLLHSGLVLVTGGWAELYDPATGMFTATGSVTTPRVGHTAKLLPDGRVLITGGSIGGSYLSSAEVYDPVDGTFTPTGSMIEAREFPTATLLPNGLVLIAGGYNSSYLSTAELYDPITGVFTLTGSLTIPMSYAADILLPDGRVLITIGETNLYSQSIGTFAGGASMTGGGSVVSLTATLLTNGRILVNGGYAFSGNSLSSAALFVPLSPVDTTSPVAGSFSINGGSTPTNNGNIILNLSAMDDMGVAAYFASESPNVPIVQAEYWMPVILATNYSGNVSFRLSNSAGTKTVYVWFKDVAGNISNMVSDSIDINNLPDNTAPTTTASPPGGIYASTQIVTLACTDNNTGCAATYYTTDGSTPTASSTIYAGPIAISANATLKFFSTDNAGNSEAVKTQTHVIDSVAPTTAASPVGGTYTTAQSVMLTCSDTNSGCAGTYYTTDGTDPTTASTVHTGLITISANTTLKYLSKDNAGNLETVKSQAYVIDSIAPTTTAFPAGGAQAVTLICTDTNTGCASTYYTTDGTTPTTSSSVYTTAITISANTTLKFFSQDNAGNSEAVKTETYVLVHSIIGAVTKNGTSLGGVTMTLSECASATTDTVYDGSYSFTNLTEGDCTVTPSLAGYTFIPPSRLITVAGADVSGQDFSAVQTWFDEDDPAVTYTGTWNSLVCNPCNNGLLKYAGQTGARAEFSFYGTGIKWHTAKAPALGKAKIYFDGVYKGMVDLYRSTVQYPLVLGGSGIPPGNHTLTIEVSGQRNSGSSGNYVLIDAFEVVP